VESILNGSHAANAKKQNIMGKVQEIRVHLDYWFRSLSKAFINFRMELPITFWANIKTTHRSILTKASTSSAKSTSQEHHNQFIFHSNKVSIVDNLNTTQPWNTPRTGIM
jgi:hypothetical protein